MDEGESTVEIDATVETNGRVEEPLKQCKVEGCVRPVFQAKGPYGGLCSVHRAERKQPEPHRSEPAQLVPASKEGPSDEEWFATPAGVIEAVTSMADRLDDAESLLREFVAQVEVIKVRADELTAKARDLLERRRT